MLKRFFWFRHEQGIKKLLKTGLQVGKDTLIFNEAGDYGYNPHLIMIGSNCVIASGVQFISNPAFIKFASGSKKFVEHKIIIHNNCFLGVNSIIFPDVVIGPNAIVGAGAVVMDDVPANMCVSGNPSRVNCTVDFYRIICKKGNISNYTSKNKRNVLQEYFWNGHKVGSSG
jgi:acetyltransferase-like isoleucine patch superfamily enzyme